MTTKRILLFGGSGQIGSALRRLKPPPDWELAAPPRAACDLTRPGDVANTIRNFAPDLVINAAALTDIDACEQNPELALLTNFDAVANIAAQCVARDAPLIQLSTDYVFDGADGGKPYAPDDLVNPVNAYGQSKWMGEEAVRHGSYGHVILRTSLVFGADGDNVLTKTLRQIDSRDEVTAVTDQTACPTAAAAVAIALVAMADAVLSGKAGLFGTFHLCGEPAVTRYEFLQAIMEAYAPPTDRRPRLTGTTAADIPGRVPRPAATALNMDKTHAVYGIGPGAWRDDLDAAIRLYAATFPDLQA